ncbi:HEAT repeat domain-containing protein [Streptomyces sp. NPDC054956]
MWMREKIWNEATPAERRLAGLAVNPATPDRLLLRLLADGPPAARMALCGDRDLPDTVVDALLDHPDKRARAVFASSRHADPAQRARFVDDPEWFVKAHLAEGPALHVLRRPRPLPDEVVVHMISTYENDLLGGLYRQISAGLRDSMPTHPEVKVRRYGVGCFGFPAELRASLLVDPDPDVRDSVLRRDQHEDPSWVEENLPDHSCHARSGMLVNDALSRAVVDSVLTAPVGEGERAALAHNSSLPYDVVVLLAADPDPAVRKCVAERADLGPAERAALAVDPDPEVRLAISLHSALTESERATIDYAVPEGGDFGPYPDWPGDPAAVRLKALSGHVLLRRSAASDHHLPPDLVALLAADADLGVRVTLAQNHPDAPAELLLRSFLEYTGRERDHLPTRPHFPTIGLAAYADHEDPAVRALVARDPEAAPDLVDRLTRDPDPEVRAALALHPNLPAARIAELLEDEELARYAAANPALDPAVMEELVDSLC